MAPSESQKRASLKWDKENMITLGCKIKREQAMRFKAYCAGLGKTSNTMLKDYVLSCIEDTPTGGGYVENDTSGGNPSE